MAEAALGDWCARLAESPDEVAGIVAGPGDPTFGQTEPEPPAESDTWTDQSICFLRQGESLEQSVVLVVNEIQFVDEAAASGELAALREPDPMAVYEDVDFGDDAIYTTFDGQGGMPPFASFSVTMRKADRIVRVSLRDFTAELPADEAARKQQVQEVFELLQA